MPGKGTSPSDRMELPGPHTPALFCVPVFHTLEWITPILRNMARRKERKSIRSNDKRPWIGALSAGVRARRKALGLSQLDLARLAGCGPVFVYAVETGKSSLRLDKLVDLLHVLGMEIAVQPGSDGLRWTSAP